MDIKSFVTIFKPTLANNTCTTRPQAQDRGLSNIPAPRASDSRAGKLGFSTGATRFELALPLQTPQTSRLVNYWKSIAIYPAVLSPVLLVYSVNKFKTVQSAA